MTERDFLLPAGEGRAVRLTTGTSIKIVNVHGTQVVDCWAFNAQDLDEYLSMPHCHSAWYRVFPASGDGLMTKRRRPILTLTEDTSPGVHDTLIACCDRTRYEELGCPEHPSCADNLNAGLGEVGIGPVTPPPPLNLFMNFPIAADGALSIAPPVSRPGDYVVLLAEMDCIVALSACPHDVFPVNGEDCTPKDVKIEIRGMAARAAADAAGDY